MYLHANAINFARTIDSRVSNNKINSQYDKMHSPLSH